MNVQPMSGPRTLISRSAGALTLPGADRPLLRTFVPSIPTGGLCVPTVDFIRMLMGREMSEGAVADIASELQDVCRREQAPPIHTQVIITEELGCIHTVSTEFIVANIEGLGLPHADTLAEGLGILLDEMADDKLGPDGMGGDVAAFESLTRLHRCAGKPRGKAPGHFREHGEHDGCASNRPQELESKLGSGLRRRRDRSHLDEAPDAGDHTENEIDERTHGRPADGRIGICAISRRTDSSLAPSTSWRSLAITRERCSPACDNSAPRESSNASGDAASAVRSCSTSMKVRSSAVCV